MAGPQVGWFGDDFTGASDTLATYAEAGIAAALLTRLPTPRQLERLGPVTALGLAGKTRALNLADIAQALGPVGPFFAGLGVRVLHYKCCSTFDSAPETGNLATAIAVLRRSFPTPTLPIVGGQPNLRRYCLFGTLFASAGQGGAVYRIDRHPTMSRHPATPMTEADLALHLQHQGFGAIGSIDYPTIAGGGAQQAFDQARARGDDAVLFDVSATDDVARIGQVIWREAVRHPLLALGASSVAQALIPELGANAPCPAPPRRPKGPAFVLVGSLSPVTRAQVAEAHGYEMRAIDADRLVTDASYGAALEQEISAILASGRPAMAVTGEQRTGRITGQETAAATARLANGILCAGITDLACIAGGDTSSFFMSGLDGWALRHRGSLGAGSPVCELSSDLPALDGLHLVLKGGQMGPPDLFDRLRAWRSEPNALV